MQYQSSDQLIAVTWQSCRQPCTPPLSWQWLVAQEMKQNPVWTACFLASRALFAKIQPQRPGLGERFADWCRLSGWPSTFDSHLDWLRSHGWLSAGPRFPLGPAKTKHASFASGLKDYCAGSTSDLGGLRWVAPQLAPFHQVDWANLVSQSWIEASSVSSQVLSSRECLQCLATFAPFQKMWSKVHLCWDWPGHSLTR